MKTRKRILCALIAVSMLFLSVLTSCGDGKDSNTTVSSQSDSETGGGSDTPTDTAKKYAVILKPLSSDFWEEMKSGIEDEAEKQDVQVDIFAADSEDDAEGQLRILEDCIDKGYKAIGVAPISKTNLIDAIVKANKKGIYIVSIDEKLDMDTLKSAGGSVAAFVSSDNEKVGKKGADYIIDALENGGEVAIIEGKEGSTSSEERKKGAADAFESAEKIKLVSSQTADWDEQKAYDAAKSIIEEHPNLKAFYCCNDIMALGALEAVKNADKLGKIMVVGTDGEEDATDSVEDGELTATVVRDSEELGAVSLRQMIKAVEEKKDIDPEKEAEVITVDCYIFDDKDD